ncbi:helix-turn-helix domain-containing protein [Blautia schinkii]|nr:helix-turn-helix domain-containing protein [Blautia schinkii]
MTTAFSENIPGEICVSHPCTENETNELLHIHDNGYEILFFIGGKVTYFFETSIYKMEPGDVMLIPPGCIHGYCTQADAVYDRIPLHIQRNLLHTLSTDKTSLLEAFQDSQHRIIHLDQSQAELFIQYTDMLLRLEEEHKYGHDILSRAYLLFILQMVNSIYRNTFCTHKDVSPKLIRSAIDYINLHLSEDLSVESISAALNISSSRLSHLFKEHMNSSVWNYVTAKRLQLARSLLLEGRSVMDACYESGFRDYSHFNKTFSKVFHMTPGKFQKAQKTDHILQS